MMTIQPLNTFFILLTLISMNSALTSCHNGGLTPWNHIKPTKNHQHQSSHSKNTPAVGIFDENADKNSETTSMPGNPDLKPTRENLNRCQEFDYFNKNLYLVISQSTCVRCHHGDHPGLDLRDEASQVCDDMISRADFNAPKNSLLLKKPLAADISHGGGIALSEDHPLYTLILKWIDQERGVGNDDQESYLPQKLRLLSNLEYQQTVKETLGLSTEVDLENDRGKIFSNQIQSFSITRAEKYLEAAFKLSEDYPLASLKGYPCQTAGDISCLSSIIEDFASKAWRRPLTDQEKENFKNFLNQQIGSADSDLLIRDALAIIIGSPKFYTRSETGTKSGQGYQLKSEEIASFISYTLFKRPPDSELLNLAMSGELTTYQSVRSTIQKRLADPETSVIYDEFVNSLFGLFQIDHLSKSATNSSFTTEFKTSAKNEIKLVFRKIIEDDKNVVSDFWKTRLTTNDPLLTAHYQSTASEIPGFHEIRNPGYKGLLSRSAFMSINAESDHGNPLKRGARLLDHFLCREFPPPPPEANEALQSGMNSREFRANNPTCASCHVEIDPVGYSMETYSETGALLSGMTSKSESLSVDKNIVTFSGLSGDNGLSTYLGNSTEANQCFIRRWYEFISGAPVSQGHEFSLINKYTEKLMSEHSFKEVLTDMITDYAMSIRSSVGGTADDQ